MRRFAGSFKHSSLDNNFSLCQYINGSTADLKTKNSGLESGLINFLTSLIKYCLLILVMLVCLHFSTFYHSDKLFASHNWGYTVADQAKSFFQPVQYTADVADRAT